MRGPAREREAKMLDDHIEIKPEAALVAIKEDPISGIRDVGMYLERVEMIGYVESTQRKPNAILIAKFEIL